MSIKGFETPEELLKNKCIRLEVEKADLESKIASTVSDIEKLKASWVDSDLSLFSWEVIVKEYDDILTNNNLRVN